MIKLLSICGSPVPGSSTAYLLDLLASEIRNHVRGKIRHTRLDANELEIVPCQACGEDPSPRFCFFEDDLAEYYSLIASCDCLIFGSPIYFDSVSAQAKAVIDRCNCFRPPDYFNTDPKHSFLKRLPRKRPGGMILVGGENTWYEGARRTIAGFFKWIEVVNQGAVMFANDDFDLRGVARDDKKTAGEIKGLAKKMARELNRAKNR